MDPSNPSSSSDLNVVPNAGNAGLPKRDNNMSNNDPILTDEVLDEIWEAAIRMIHNSQDDSRNQLDTGRDTSGTMTCIS